MIKEIAFVAMAVSDFAKSRKFYQETLELKPESSAMEGFPWAEYDVGGVTIGVGLSSELAAVARRNDHCL